jgi:hypothetical protein
LTDDFLFIGADGSLTNKEEVQIRFAGETAVVTGRFIKIRFGIPMYMSVGKETGKP